jgi:hypothetical protein
MPVANHHSELPLPPHPSTPRISDTEIEAMLREAFQSAIEQGEVTKVDPSIRQKA